MERIIGIVLLLTSFQAFGHQAITLYCFSESLHNGEPFITLRVTPDINELVGELDPIVKEEIRWFPDVLTIRSQGVLYENSILITINRKDLKFVWINDGDKEIGQCEIASDDNKI